MICDCGGGALAAMVAAAAAVTWRGNAPPSPLCSRFESRQHDAGSRCSELAGRGGAASAALAPRPAPAGRERQGISQR